MIKTCINVAAVGKAPEIVKKMIDENGFPISTIVIEPERVSFYFCYKWYDYYHIYKIKREVKRCEERYKYYYKPYIYRKRFTQKTKFYSDKFEKAYARFSYATVQGDPECRNDETTVNKEEIK